MLNMEKIKKIALVIVSIVALGILIELGIFIHMKLFSKESVYEEKIEELNLSNKQLQKDRDSIAIIEETIRKRLEVLSKIENDLRGIVDRKDLDISREKINSQKIKLELDSIRTNINNIRKRIENFKKSPPNRNEEDLINSIKIKTKK